MSETESNNSLSTADTLVSGSEMTGQLSSETDIDYFSIAATAAGSVSISFDPTVNSSYTEYYTVSYSTARVPFLPAKMLVRILPFLQVLAARGRIM